LVIYHNFQEGVGITNGWRTCNHVDSVQDAWLVYFGNFDLVSKQIEMTGAQSKCFGNFDARIEMDQNRLNWLK
jgi:hypothetical protein